VAAQAVELGREPESGGWDPLAEGVSGPQNRVLGGARRGRGPWPFGLRLGCQPSPRGDMGRTRVGSPGSRQVENACVGSCSGHRATLWGGDSAPVGRRGANCPAIQGWSCQQWPSSAAVARSPWKARLPPGNKRGSDPAVGGAKAPEPGNGVFLWVTRDNKSAAEDWLEASLPAGRQHIVRPGCGGIASLQGIGDPDQAGPLGSRIGCSGCLRMSDSVRRGGPPRC